MDGTLSSYLQDRSWHQLNPDSAVAIDRKREAQPFRSKVDGFLPLRSHRSAVLGDDTMAHRNDVRERKITLKVQSRTPFAASEFRLAPDIFGFTAESGLNVNNLLTLGFFSFGLL